MTVGIYMIFAALALGIVMLVRRIRKKPNKVLKPAALFLLIAGIVITILSIGADDTPIALSMLLMLAAVILLLSALIRRLRKKPAKPLLLAAVASLLLGFVLLFAATGGLSVMASMVGFLLGAVFVVLLPVLLVKLIRHTAGRRLKLAAAISLALCVVLLFAGSALSAIEVRHSYENHEQYEVQIEVDPNFEVKDGDEPIEVVEYRVSDFGEKTYYVYDAAHLYTVFDKVDPTLEECIAVINANDGIGEKFKPLITDLVQRLFERYPDVPYAILYNNLQTLTISELDSKDYFLKSLSMDSLGVYFRNENAIYIPKGTEYTEGDFGFQVLVHEFCHCARSCWFQESFGNRVQFSEEYDGDVGSLLEEAMNSVFSCTLLNYYEWDIAYQTASNYLRIMLECMDNYELSDYMTHSDNYFYRKLDEYTGYTNYARTIWKLIALERNGYDNDRIDIPAERYEDIYKYLCDLYYGKYITADMTDEQAQAVADELVYKAFYDSPYDKINEQFFYDYLAEYRNSPEAAA